MKIRMPEYYRQFRCIAGACPDSCCKEWEVDIDPEAAALYRSLDSSLGDRLRQVLKDTEDGTVMTIIDGRCPMWRNDGLCRIQAELGHDALCHVCRKFPRLRHDYGDFVELGLELSCPEAARLILSAPNHAVWEEASDATAPEYDTEAMQILLQSRHTATQYLQTTSLAPNLALCVLLLYTHEVQSWLDGGEAAHIDEPAALALAQKHAGTCHWEWLTDFFQGLEILTPQWRNRLSAPASVGDWHTGYLALAQYFIDRYWLQAVSDYDLISRIKLMLAACLLVFHLGGNFVETAQLFSKEIENDPDNLEAIFDGAYTDPTLTDVHLLSLLQHR